MSRSAAGRLGVGGLALVGAISFALPVHASPEDIFGFGARSAGMAATGAASAEDYEAVYKNPALLTYSHDARLHLGVMGADFELATAVGGRAPARASNDRLLGTFIGATLPIPLEGVMKDRFTLGFAFFTPTNLIVRGHILYPERPQFLLPDRTQSVAVQAALGIDVSWWRGRSRSEGLHVGGGFAALAALAGDVLVAVDGTGKIGSSVSDTLVAAYAPIVGASFDLGRSYRVGTTFRGALVGRFDVQIVVKDLGAITVPPLQISGVAQYDPWQIETEIARTRGPLRAALSLTYKHWSAYPGPPEATVRCPTDPDTGKVEECGALVPPPPRFHDTVVPRLGVEYEIPLRDGVTTRVRGGYAFEPTPAPKQHREANLYDESRSIFAWGAGLSVRPPLLEGLDLDVFGQAQVIHGRDHEKDPGIPATNPGAPLTRTSGFVLAAGTQVGVSF
jgi:long-chain fatty acid transport protein